MSAKRNLDSKWRTLALSLARDIADIRQMNEHIRADVEQLKAGPRRDPLPLCECGCNVKKTRP